MSKHKIDWIDRGREPQNPPNPAYPNGVDIDAGFGVPACKVELPYPAKRCGYYLIECSECGMRVGCTTAGRADDPRSIAIPCGKKKKQPITQEQFENRVVIAGVVLLCLSLILGG